MSNIIFRTTAFIHHKIRTIISRKGYGIHSPFAFSFVNEIIYPDRESGYYKYNAIEKMRHRLFRNDTPITLIDGKTTSIKRIAKTSLAPAKDAQLLFRIATFMRSRRIIELGTSLGITSAYLASTSPSTKVISIDHNEACLAVATKNLALLGLDNITLVNNTFDQALAPALADLKKLDLLYVDGNHTGDTTMDYFTTALKHITPNSVIVFHDIHWSKDMYCAWNTIIKHHKITVSFECYNIGIVFFDPDLNKQHFRV